MRYAFILIIVAVLPLMGCASGACGGTTAGSAVGGVPYADLNLPGLRLPAPLTFGQTPKFSPQGYVQAMPPQACAPVMAPVPKAAPGWVPATQPAPATAGSYCP